MTNAMTDVIPCSLTEMPWDEMSRAAQAAADAVEAEAAVREMVHCALRVTGDGQAHERPGALKPSERHFHVVALIDVTALRMKSRSLSSSM